MELVYIKGTPFGEFYYDKKKHTGVAVPTPASGIEPVVIGMRKEYNPFDDPSAIILNVEEAAFKHLYDAANKRDRNLVGKIVEEHFLDKIKGNIKS